MAASKVTELVRTGNAIIIDGEEMLPRQRPQLSKRDMGLLNYAAEHAVSLAHNRRLRTIVLDNVKERLANPAQPSPRSQGVTEDRQAFSQAIMATVERALENERLSDAYIDRLASVLLIEQLVKGGDWEAREKFQQEQGCNPPGFMVISPCKQCNLQCAGCYASSTAPDKNKLSWDVFDRALTEIHDLWGIKFVVVSGGEPMMYRDQGRDLIDMAQAHPGLFFMFYTNGTLIGDEEAKRMASVGNLIPCISIEGFEEATDARRGKGTWAKIMAATDRLNSAKVPFGVSMTATNQNYQELLSDELLDLFFTEKGAIIGWIFQLMPIGRAVSLDLMLTPEQRLWMWQRTWEQIRKRGIFLADFWNSATLCEGCVSAGRPGGYLYIDWDGKVAPCVFNPYSPININDVYAKEGTTITDAWADPFFRAIRTWQYRYGFRESGNKEPKNLLMPCPIRDHHAEMVQMIREYEPDPVDEAAAVALKDPDYHRGLEEFDRELAARSEPIWREKYVD